MIEPIPAIEVSLRGILTHLERLKRPVVDALLPPLSSDGYAAAIQGLPMSPPTEVERLYRWRNGTNVLPGDSLDDSHIFPGFYWFSLPDAVHAYGAFSDDPRWDPSWLPLFANGGGDFYAVKCSTSVAEDVGAVIGFILGEEEQPVEYVSIPCMLATLDACFAEGAFFVSPDGYLEADDAKQFEIAKRFNGRLDFYNR